MEPIPLFRRYIELMNASDYDGLEEVLTEDHVWHGIGNDSQGLGAFRDVLRTYRGALPDVHMEIEHVFAGDGFVGARVWHRGTHTGNAWPRPATGKAVAFPLHVHARLAGGLIAEVGESWNLAQLRDQLAAD